MKANPITQRVKSVAKQVKSTISNKQAKGINVENISAVQEKEGKKFVVEVDEKEYYDPNAKDNIGGMDDTWDSNYNDIKYRRDTVVVNPSYNVGDLIDETEWEKGKATKSVTKQTVKKLKSEHPDTWIYKGDSPHEQIIDLEDRIGFIKEDVFNTGKTSFRQKKDLNKLNKALNQLKTKMETGKGSYGNEEWDKE